MKKMSSTFLLTFLLISYCLFVTLVLAKLTTKTQAHAFDGLFKDELFTTDDFLSGKGASILGVHYDDSVNEDKFKIITQQGSRDGDKVVRLPGQPSVRFDQYGGYVTVDKKAGRAFFYYFVEAEDNKHSKPLLLWLNGGPGCSSLGYGAMTELGPFRVHSDGKTLYKNPYAWNNAANVLILESPAGVGFSYSNTSSDVENGGDRKTAEDNYIFLLNWLERFPEYKDRDFYISGESYAGHYVPQLAHNILLHNKRANKTLINLKGIMIGNALINRQTDSEGRFDYLNSHALISDISLSQIKKDCDFSNKNRSKECASAMMAAFSAIEFLDVYNIYYPLCHNTNLTAVAKKASVLRFDPCNDHYVYAYLNNPQVQEALHANVTKISYDWQPCSNVIKHWEHGATSMIPLLQEFIQFGLRVWVYSGDLDARIPVTSTKHTLRIMNLTVKTPYYPWFLHNEVGGYTEVYEEGLTFATVRGAGHQVPSYQPARALSLVMHFLGGTQFPKK